TPEETAVSILAEILVTTRGATGKSLKGLRGPIHRQRGTSTEPPAGCAVVAGAVLALSCHISAWETAELYRPEAVMCVTVRHPNESDPSWHTTLPAPLGKIVDSGLFVAPRPVAGEIDAASEVSEVSVMMLPDIGPWLRPGQLLVTSTSVLARLSVP